MGTQDTGPESLLRRVWAHLASRLVRIRSDLATALLDAVLVTTAFAAMLWLRFDGDVPARQWETLTTFVPIAVGVMILSNLAWGLYGQL